MQANGHSNQTLTGITVLEMLVSYMIENLYLCRVDTMIQNRTTTHTIVRKRRNNMQNELQRSLSFYSCPKLTVYIESQSTIGMP
jgi:hypothetical protein